MCWMREIDQIHRSGQNISKQCQGKGWVVIKERFSATYNDDGVQQARGQLPRINLLSSSSERVFR